MDVTDYVAASCHVSFARFALGDINDRIEEVGLAMLASKVPADDIIVIRKMRLAVLTTVNAVRVEVNVVC